MAKNKIQFQQGFSLQEFISQYGCEQQCRQALIQWRWPQGFQQRTGSGFHILTNRPAVVSFRYGKKKGESKGTPMKKGESKGTPMKKCVA